MALAKKGRSAGVRLEIRFPSTTTGSSAQTAPAFSRSSLIPSDPVARRPFRIFAETNHKSQTTHGLSWRMEDGIWHLMCFSSCSQIPISPWKLALAATADANAWVGEWKSWTGGAKSRRGNLLCRRA